MVTKASSPRLVEEQGEILYPNNVSSEGDSESGGCHDGDNYMLLHVESARVEVPRKAKGGEFHVGEDGLKQLARWESTGIGFVRQKEIRRSSSSQQLSDVGTHGDAWIANTEELVDESPSGNEDGTDEPSTKSACGNGGIVTVIDNSAHFSVRGILPQGLHGVL